MYIKLDNCDTFAKKNALKKRFKSIEDSLSVCKSNNYSAFVVFKGVVYYRSQLSKDCVMNTKYHEGSDLYVLTDEELISCEERLSFYTHGLIKLSSNVLNNATYLTKMKNESEKFPDKGV